MSYCLPSDVTALNKLFQTTTFTDAYVQTFINKAVARLNNLLQPHYVIPLADPVPPIINSIVADMAASLLCQTHFSGVNYRENTPMAEVYRKRAESDLEHVLTNSTLDDFENVVKQQPDVPEMRRAVASTTPHQNQHMKGRLKRFNWATQSPLSNVREWP
ncbi:phage protein Gp36 family protein [Desulfosporosinus sp. FKA]|uniref:phage protein Gp36 family protein n=1 Tax=Desulfosporosinus sp. FKA TaxID=1969834 RepID=UPI000B4981FE|nr:phage protein Gp36 family protein [Desulfosporosinus sp. FKA]